MGTTAQKLQNIIDTKADLSALIKNNGGTVPAEFRKYPETIAPMIGGGGGGIDIAKAMRDGYIDLIDEKGEIKIVPSSNPFSTAGEHGVRKIIFSECVEVQEKAFYNVRSLIHLEMPKLRKVGKAAFIRAGTYANMDPMIFPELEEISEQSFAISKIIRFEAPKLKYVPINGFQNSHMEYLDIRGATYIEKYGLNSCARYATNSAVIYANAATTFEEYSFPSNSSGYGIIIYIDHPKTIMGNQFDGYSKLVEIRTKSTMAQIKALAGYPWNSKGQAKWVCSDGTFTI